jgi:hypothetical protein
MAQRRVKGMKRQARANPPMPEPLRGKMQEKSRNICICQKKAVILQAKFANNKKQI